MEKPHIFSFSDTTRRANPHCPFCGGRTIEVLSIEYPIGPTGIFRCLTDDCDSWHVPSMPEMDAVEDTDDDEHRPIY
jgi:hypothetical protein